jgi:hypothetical protein
MKEGMHEPSFLLILLYAIHLSLQRKDKNKLKIKMNILTPQKA